MFVDILIIVVCITNQNNRQQVINQNLIIHNCKYYDSHDQLGDKVIMRKYDLTKMQEKLNRPHPIVELRTNGTV